MALESTVARVDLLTDPESFGNDLPTYRALSALALTSTGVGLLSGLSFISWYWLALAGLAVMAGVIADLRIRRMPDILTGRSFAHAGIAMGLIFGITSITHGLWTTYTLKSAAMTFARDFADSLNQAGSTSPIDTGEPIWYMVPPSMAKEIGPEEAKSKMAEMLKSSDKAATIDETMKQMLRYAGPGNPITVVQAEKIVVKDGDILVSILVKVGDGRPRPKPSLSEPAKPDHDHADHDHAKDSIAAETGRGERDMAIFGEGPEHALVLVHGTESGRKILWYVDQIRYPYQPQSFTPVVAKKPVDDGHGH